MARVPRSALIAQQSEAFLHALFSEAPEASYVELRWRRGGGMRRAFHHVDELAAAASEIARLAHETDVYVGVLPRRRRGGGRNDLVPVGRVLWVDCDTAVAAAALRTFSPPPSIVIASGSRAHRHAYWLLQEAAAVGMIEAANRALSSFLGADVGCADAARILRPPSLNHKQSPAVPVRLLRCESGLTYAIGDVVDPLMALPAESTSDDRGPRLDDDDPLLGLEPAMYVEVLAGLRVPRDRKVRCPFHEDDSPSLHLYAEPARGWYCYGCRRGGSVYDFAAALWGLSTRGNDFCTLQHLLDELLSVVA